MNDRQITEYHVQVELEGKGRFCTVADSLLDGGARRAIFGSKSQAEWRMSDLQAKYPDASFRIHPVRAIGVVID